MVFESQRNQPLEFKVRMSQSKKRYKPVGRCIYCGRKATRLGDEHVIPYALAGNAIVLPKASCRNCEAITGRFEQNCLRKMLGPLRTRINLPTRRPKEREKILPLIMGKFNSSLNKDEFFRFDIPVLDYPIFYAAPCFGEPGILRRVQPEDLPNSFRAIGIGNHRLFIEYLLEYGYDIGFVGTVTPRSFLQMLAKIGHAYTVAEVGIGNFDPLCLDIIFEKNKKPRYLIGSDDEIPAPTDSAFDISLNFTNIDGIRYIVVYFRMFSSYKTPVYKIVSGKLP